MRQTMLALVGITTLMLSTTAHAWHCPELMERVDRALAEDPDVSAETLEEIRELRAMGEQLHEQAQHQAAVDYLEEALELLTTET